MKVLLCFTVFVVVLYETKNAVLYIIKDPAEMSLITPPLLLVFLLMNPGESTL